MSKPVTINVNAAEFVVAFLDSMSGESEEEYPNPAELLAEFVLHSSKEKKNVLLLMDFAEFAILRMGAKMQEGYTDAGIGDEFAFTQKTVTGDKAEISFPAEGNRRHRRASRSRLY